MMNLLDRYLAAVAAELPADKQQDIIRELKANLLDGLDALANRQEQPLTEQQTTEFLQQQGHPVIMAQRYVPDAPLIAGEDMPLFRTVLWYGAALLFVLALLKSLGVLVQLDSVNPVRLLLQLAAAFVDDFAWFLLMVIAVFYTSGRAGWSTEWRQRHWDIRQLPRYPQARIDIADILSDIVSCAFLLLLLWTPLWMSAEAQAALPLRLANDMEFWRYLLTGLSALSLLFALYRLMVRCWQRWSLALYIADHLVFAAVFVAMAYQTTPVIQPAAANGWWWPRVAGNIDLVLLATAAVLAVLALIEFRRWRRLA